MVKIAKVRFKEGHGDTVKECSNCEAYIFNKEKYCGACGALLQWGENVPEIDDCDHEFRFIRQVNTRGNGADNIFYCIHCLQFETRRIIYTHLKGNTKHFDYTRGKHEVK